MSSPLSHQLFHGTIETLKPGDVIRPRTEHGAAWATSDLEYALKHAHERARTGFGDKPGGEYPVHHANIYSVEPVGSTRESDEPHNKGAYMSKEGFRVTGQVASVLGQPDNHETIKRSFPEFDPSKESYVKNGRDGGRI
jgi:hypothetical protein